LKHPNIVELYDTVGFDNMSFCTILEYCDGQDLQVFMKKHKTIPEKEAKLIIR
jgi:tousled-like kinase